MAIQDIETRLKSRLEGVPGVTDEKIAVWVIEAISEMGYLSDDPNLEDNSAFHLALSYAYENAAQTEAGAFRFTDKDQTVDKTNVFENYRTLAAMARKDYRKARRRARGGQYHVRRADECGEADER